MKGHIRRRGDDSWAVVIYVGKDAAGKDKYRWYSVKGTKKQAEAKLAELLNSMNQGAYVEPSRLTVGEYLKKWLAEAAKPTVKPKTYEWYRQTCELHLIPELGKIPLARLRPLDLQSYFTRALSFHQRGKEKRPLLSPTSVRGHYRILHRALEQAVRWGLVARNVADAIDPPRAERKEMRTLDRDQAVQFLQAARETDHYPLYLAAVTTGMRQGELLALQWADVDLKAGTASVRRTLRRASDPPVFDTPKSAKGVRQIVLLTELVTELRRLRKVQAADRLRLGPEYHDYGLIFAQPDGRPLSPRTIYDEFKRLLSRAKLPPIRFHDLRHTHASLMLAQGVNLKVVSERLGHSTVAITGDIYSHVLPTLQEQAAAVLETALFGPPKPAETTPEKPPKTQGS